ncbi:hypothetical protein HK096_006563, partial [Nowakowskiella sp. JEL0078]
MANKSENEESFLRNLKSARNSLSKISLNSTSQNVKELLASVHQALYLAEESYSKLKTVEDPSALNKTLINESDLLSHNDSIGNSSLFPYSVPLIPVSPVIRQLVYLANQLYVANTRLLSAKNSASSLPLNQMRKLVEDVNVQQTKVDRLTKVITSTTNHHLTAFSANVLALQLTILSLNLFGKLKPREHLPVHRYSSEVKAFCDFSTFTERIFINQILLSKPASVLPSSPSSVISNAPFLGRAQTISHLILTSYSLLYVYRNVASVTSVLRALDSPEIRRLRRTWELVSLKHQTLYRQLCTLCPTSVLMGSHHKELLSDLLDSHFRRGSSVVVIPSLEPFVAEIEDINSAYVVGHQPSTVHIGGSLETSTVMLPVLSDIGTRMQEEIISQIEMCQGKGRLDSISIAAMARISNRLHQQKQTSSSGGRPEGVESHEIPAVPDDLMDLVSLNANDSEQQIVGHWILTRVFLNRKLLWEISIDCEAGKTIESCPYPEEQQFKVNQDVLLTSPPELAVFEPPVFEPIEGKLNTKDLFEEHEDIDIKFDEVDEGQDEFSDFDLPTVPKDLNNGDESDDGSGTDAEFERRVAALTKNQIVKEDDTRLDDVLKSAWIVKDNVKTDLSFTNMWTFDITGQENGKENNLLADESGIKLTSDFSTEEKAQDDVPKEDDVTLELMKRLDQLR